MYEPIPLSSSHSLPAIPDLLAQARTNRPLAESLFNRLPTEQQSLLIAQARAEDRMSLLLLAADCAELVRTMNPVALAQTVLAADDDADVLARFATAQQLAAAIDLDCRHAGRIVPQRFHRWISILVASSISESAQAIRELDVRLLAVGLRPYVRYSEGLDERLRVDRYADQSPSIGTADLDSDDEDVMAFLHLLEAEAPQVLSAVAELLIEEDAEELFNEDYAGYEERMDAIGLRDYGRAAEVYGAGPAPDEDPASASRAVADTSTTFLRQVLAAMIAHRDCSETTIEEISRQLLELSNDVAMADGAGSDEAAVLSARAKTERLIAEGLLRRSHGDVDQAVAALLEGDLRGLLRAGRG
jgi:hypothetical protein